jgi:hypothetical protein
MIRQGRSHQERTPEQDEGMTIPRHNQEEDEVAALATILDANEDADEVVPVVIKYSDDELFGITPPPASPVSINLGVSC